MATATKTARTLQAAASNPAGGTTVGGTLALATALGGLATLVVTNGGTPPAAGCSAILDVSPDGARWSEYARLAAGTAPGAAYEFHVEVPPAVMNLRSRFTGNSGQPVTVEAFFQELTALG